MECCVTCEQPFTNPASLLDAADALGHVLHSIQAVFYGVRGIRTEEVNEDLIGALGALGDDLAQEAERWAKQLFDATRIREERAKTTNQ